MEINALFYAVMQAVANHAEKLTLLIYIVYIFIFSLVSLFFSCCLAALRSLHAAFHSASCRAFLAPGVSSTSAAGDLKRSVFSATHILTQSSQRATARTCHFHLHRSWRRCSQTPPHPRRCRPRLLAGGAWLRQIPLNLLKREFPRSELQTRHCWRVIESEGGKARAARGTASREEGLKVKRSEQMPEREKRQGKKQKVENALENINEFNATAIAKTDCSPGRMQAGRSLLALTTTL
jgi:hypothetical protein